MTRRWRKFRDRTLSTLDYPNVILDATYCKARANHRIVSQAIVVAVGVAADGRREVLGFDVGDTKERGVLDPVSPRAESAWPRRGEVGHVGRPLKG